jgi:hypothetical protein
VYVFAGWKGSGACCEMYGVLVGRAIFVRRDISSAEFYAESCMLDVADDVGFKDVGEDEPEML